MNKKNIKGISYIIFAALCFSFMSACVKFLLNNYHVIEIMFLRSLFGLLILIFLIKLKHFKIKKTYFRFHFFRTILALLAMYFTFTALEHLPLSNLTIINFSKIFFIIPIAVIILKENTKFSDIINILIGFLGIIIIIGIDLESHTKFKYYIFAFIGTCLIALIKVLIKKISYLEKSLNIQFWFSFYSTCFLLFPYLKLAKVLSLSSLIIMILASMFGLLAQFFTIEGLRHAKSAKVMTFDFFRVIFATIIGFFLFSENITLLFLLGSFFIFISGLRLSKN